MPIRIAAAAVGTVIGIAIVAVRCTWRELRHPSQPPWGDGL
jgi:hypothetical protein